MSDPHDPFVGELSADRFKVRDLLQYAREGRLRVPHFHRPLCWRREQELELFDSLYHRYPIGTLLLWSRYAPAGVATFGVVSIEAPERHDALWIVDGQQRLNTLIGALLHPRAEAADRTRGIEIAFDLLERRFVTCRGYVPPTAVPVHRLVNPVDTAAWARERGVSDELHTRAQQVGDALVNYEVPTYTTSAKDDSVLRKMFTRANTTGVARHPDELFKALNTPPSGDTTVLTPLEEVVSRARFGKVADKTLMKVLLAVSGTSPRSARPDLDDGVALSAHVQPAAAALALAIDLLRDEAQIPHAALVPGDLALLVLTHFLHRFPSPNERTVELLVRWVWRAAIAGSLSLTNEHVHRAFRIVQQGDEHSVVQTLLGQLATSAPTEWQPSRQFNPRGHSTRIELCVLASLQPQTLAADGEWAAVDPSELFDEVGVPELLRLRVGDPAHDKRTATRLLAARDQLAQLAHAPDEALRSHALDPSDRAELRGVVSDGLVERRAARLDAHVEAFLRAHTRWNDDGDVPSFAVAFTDEAEPA